MTGFAPVQYASYTPVQAYSSYTPVQQSYTPVPQSYNFFQGAPTDKQILANFPPGSQVVHPASGVQPVGPITWTTPTVRGVPQQIVQPNVVQRPVIMQAPPPRVEHITVIHGPNGEVIGEERGEGWGNWGGLPVETMQRGGNRMSMEWDGAYGGMGGGMMAPPPQLAAPAPTRGYDSYGGGNRMSMEWGGAYGGSIGQRMAPQPMPAAPAPTRGYDSYAYGGYAGVEFGSGFQHADGGYRTLAERFPLQSSRRGRWVERPAHGRHEEYGGYATGGHPANSATSSHR